MKSARWFEKVFENSPDPTWIINDQNLFVLCNTAATKTLGYGSIKALQSIHPSELSPKLQPDGQSSREKADEMMAIAHRKGVHRFEWVHQRRNGECFPVEVTLSHLEDNGTAYLYCIWRDITDRKQAEQVLKKSEELFTSTFALAAIGLAQVAPDGSWLRVNQRLCDIVGYSRGELLQLSFQAITHPDDLEKDLVYVNQMLAGEIDSYTMEKRYICKDKSTVWINLTVSLVRKKNGDPDYFISAIEDISERKNIERSLKKSEEQMRTMFEEAPLGIALIDSLTGEIYEVNSKFAAIAGRSREEMVNNIDWQSITHPDDVQEDLDNMALLNAGKIPGFSMEKRYIHPDDSTVWINMTIAPLNVEDKTKPRHLCMIEDISERKLSESERENLISTLEIKNKEVEHFTYTVSHDLKSPLISIQGFASMLKKDAIAGDMQRIDEDARQIQVATSSMDRLLNELLEFSRVGRLDNPHEDIPMNELVDEVIHLLSGTTPKNIEFDIQPQLPAVSADRPRIRALLQNLIENAVKFMGDQPDPFIEIAATSKDHEIVYTIKDNGLGIDQEYQKKVFGMFEHLNPEIEGTGMGLALAKRIVEVHGGRIWLESDGDDCGTTLFFTLSEQREAS